jgi:hypothetical protein
MRQPPCQPLILTALIAFSLAGLFTSPVRAALPQAWGVGNEKEYEVSRDTNLKHGGEASVQIHSSADAPENAGVIAQFLRADNFRGKRVRLTGFVKPEAVERWGGLWLRVDTAERIGVQYGNTKSQDATGTADWAQHHIIVDVPDDATTISLGATLIGKGQLWVDDLALDVVGNDLPTNGYPVTGQPRPQPQKKSLTAPAELVNADFEK